jgi:hypothetical protein
MYKYWVPFTKSFFLHFIVYRSALLFIYIHMYIYIYTYIYICTIDLCDYPKILYVVDNSCANQDSGTFSFKFWMALISFTAFLPYCNTYILHCHIE